MARMCRSATSRTSTMPNRWRGAMLIVPSSIALTTRGEDSSVVRVGPRMNVGLTVTSSVPPPSCSIRSHAARSAITLDRG